MNILTNKQYDTNSYGTISRYTSFPFYFNTKDSKYIYGITSHLNTDISYVEHTVTSRDTLDNMALTYYGRPDLFWIIADFNRLNDPFIKLSERYETLKIPTISAISFGA